MCLPAAEEPLFHVSFQTCPYEHSNHIGAKSALLLLFPLEPAALGFEWRTGTDCIFFVNKRHDKLTGRQGDGLSTFYIEHAKLVAPQ